MASKISSTHREVCPRESQGSTVSSNLAQVARIFLKNNPKPEVLTQDFCFRAILRTLDREKLDLRVVQLDCVRGIRNSAEQTLYQVACINGLIQSVEQLLDKNRILLNTLYPGHPRRGLHDAALGGQLDLVTYLLDGNYGIGVDDFRLDGKTALHAAIDGKCPTVVRELLRRGANLNVEINYRHHELDIVSYTVATGALGCFDMIIDEVPSSVDLKRCVRGLGNLLHVAIHYNELEILQHLLVSYDRVFSDIIDQHHVAQTVGFTPLSLAAKEENCDAIELLLRSGASIDKKDRDGNAAIHFAARGGKAKAITFLDHHGCELEQENSNRERPCDLAIDTKIKSQIRALIKQRERQGNAKPLIFGSHLVGVPARNRNFLDRPLILKYLEQELVIGDRRYIILVGDRRTGKTELAKEFAYRSSDHFSRILWIDEADVIGSISRILRDSFQRDVKDPSQPKLINILQGELASCQQEKILIICKGGKTLRHWRSIDNKGVKVIALQKLRSGSNKIRVEDLTPDECVAAFREVRRIDRPQDLKHMPTSPVFVSMAVAYLKAVPDQTIEDFCTLFGSAKPSTELLIGAILDHRCKRDPSLHSILQMMQFLGGTVFPTQWFQKRLKYNQGIIDPRLAKHILEEVLEELVEFQLIEWNSDRNSFSIPEYFWEYLVLFPLNESNHYSVSSQEIANFLGSSTKAIFTILDHLMENDPYLNNVFQGIGITGPGYHFSRVIHLWLLYCQRSVRGKNLAEQVLRRTFTQLEAFRLLKWDSQEDKFTISNAFWEYLSAHPSMPTKTKVDAKFLCHPVTLEGFDAYDSKTWEEGQYWLRSVRKILREPAGERGAKLEDRLRIINHLNTFLLASNFDPNFADRFGCNLRGIERLHFVTSTIEWCTWSQKLKASLLQALKQLSAKHTKDSTDSVLPTSTKQDCDKRLKTLLRQFSHVPCGDTYFYPRKLNFRAYMISLIGKMRRKLVHADATQCQLIKVEINEIQFAFSQCVKWLHKTKQAITSDKSTNKNQLSALQMTLVQNCFTISLSALDLWDSENLVLLPSLPISSKVQHSRTRQKPLAEVERLCMEGIKGVEAVMTEDICMVLQEPQQNNSSPTYKVSVLQAKQLPFRQALAILVQNGSHPLQQAKIHSNLGWQYLQWFASYGGGLFLRNMVHRQNDIKKNDLEKCFGWGDPVLCEDEVTTLAYQEFEKAREILDTCEVDGVHSLRYHLAFAMGDISLMKADQLLREKAGNEKTLAALRFAREHFDKARKLVGKAEKTKSVLQQIICPTSPTATFEQEEQLEWIIKNTKKVERFVKSNESLHA